MLDLNYGVVEIAGRWTIIGQGLRFGSFATAAEAEAIARKLAEQAAGLPVQLHVQDAWGELVRTSPPGQA
jgi:hypothetical protein